jgi:hypothetical protein
MDGKSRWRGWLVPWLLGAAMQSGCQLFNPNTTAEPPLANGPAGQDRLVAVAQPGVDPTTIKPLPVPTVPNSGGQSSYAPVSLSAPVLSQAANPPPPPSVLPPPVAVTPLPTLPPAAQPPAGPSITFLEANADGDAHQLVRPSVGGAISNLPPGEHPVERLAEMTLRLQAKEEETKKLEARLQQLTAALEQRAQSVSQSTREVQEATEEIRRTRTTLQSTRQEVDDAWAALQRREKDDIDLVKGILEKMERPTENPPSPGTDDRAPARP